MNDEQTPIVFQKNNDTIYWGDALTVLQDYIDDDSVDLIFADPPYNLGKKFGDFLDKWPSDEAYLAWCYSWLELCVSKLISTGSMFIMASTQNMPYLDLYLRDKIHILSRMVWIYDSSGVQARKRFGSMYEPILHCVKDEQRYVFNGDEIKVEAKTGAKRGLIDYRKDVPAPYNTTKTPGNVWEFARVRYRMDEYEKHPSQKPEALLERIIKVGSNPGDVVLDPFSGTFTTSAVAQRFDRQTIGIEMQEEYIKIGLRRLNIQNHHNGELLMKPQKSYKRRCKVHPAQKSLFEDS